MEGKTEFVEPRAYGKIPGALSVLDGSRPMKVLFRPMLLALAALPFFSFILGSLGLKLFVVFAITFWPMVIILWMMIVPPTGTWVIRRESIEARMLGKSLGPIPWSEISGMEVVLSVRLRAIVTIRTRDGGSHSMPCFIHDTGPLVDWASFLLPAESGLEIVQKPRRPSFAYFAVGLPLLAGGIFLDCLFDARFHSAIRSEQLWAWNNLPWIMPLKHLGVWVGTLCAGHYLIWRFLDKGTTETVRIEGRGASTLSRFLTLRQVTQTGTAKAFGYPESFSPLEQIRETRRPVKFLGIVLLVLGLAVALIAVVAYRDGQLLVGGLHVFMSILILALAMGVFISFKQQNRELLAGSRERVVIDGEHAWLEHLGSKLPIRRIRRPFQRAATPRKRLGFNTVWIDTERGRRRFDGVAMVEVETPL